MEDQSRLSELITFLKANDGNYILTNAADPKTRE